MSSRRMYRLAHRSGPSSHHSWGRFTWICSGYIRLLVRLSASLSSKKACFILLFENCESKPSYSAGPIATKTPRVRGLRTIKKDILRLADTFIKKAEDLEAVNENIIPVLLEAILGDYNRNAPAARDAEVLNVMVTLTSRLGVCLRI
jgi:hypothetical protein